MWLLYVLYSNFHKKTGIWFSWKKFLHKCLFKIPLWREIDNITSYILISSENLKWKQHFHTDRFRNYQLLNMAVWWGLISRRGRGRGKGYWWATIACLLSHRWCDVEKLTVPGSGNFRAQHKVLFKRGEGKICYILFS